MQPPYELTPRILHLLTAVSEQVGTLKAVHRDRPSPQLRKQNQVKTIHHSLQIEGNTLSESQITALIEGKRVLGPSKDVLEVQNAIAVYAAIESFDFKDEGSFLRAHEMMMTGLMDRAGQYRKQGVGVVKGKEVQHYAPPHDRLRFLMKDLFSYLSDSEDPALIKSCVFHYEVEFIHPFLDGNGRMGRLWQTVVLSSENPVFAYLPFETLIRERQEEYYRVLALCDKAGSSTQFIEYMLDVIHQSLQDFLETGDSPKTQMERLEYFCERWTGTFTRKDYLNEFKALSTATASRDLKAGVEQGLLEKHGNQNTTYYRILQTPL